jgi:hypothetical protein
MAVTNLVNGKKWDSYKIWLIHSVRRYLWWKAKEECTTCCFYPILSVECSCILAVPFYGPISPAALPQSKDLRFFLHGATAPVGQDLLVIEASRSQSDSPQSVGLLWTNNQPDAETSTWPHTTLTRDRHPCPRRDSNPQSQQGSGCRTTRLTARPLWSTKIGDTHLITFRWVPELVWTLSRRDSRSCGP